MAKSDDTLENFTRKSEYAQTIEQSRYEPVEKERPPKELEV
ncbi:hypothetical protein [Planococcus sp. 4-30]|nr:hypothetical protein [Planococcus sp. 4-30]